MKKILVILLAMVTASACLSSTIFAASPKVKVKKYDGYSIVTISGVNGCTIRYTTNGKKPTAKSAKYKAGTKLKFTKSGTLRYAIYQGDNRWEYHSCKINVKKKSTAKVNSSGSKFEQAMDKEKLYPCKSGTELDDYVEKAINEAVTDDMSTSEKIAACYDWLVKNIKYKVTGEPITVSYEMRGMSTWEDYLLVEQALFAFKKGYGVCDNFAAAFVVMCRRIGVEAYWVSGQCKSVNGGYTPHSWAAIAVGTTLKQYDPMLDASYAQKNKLSSSRKYYEREDGDSLYKDASLIRFSNYS